MTYLQPSDFAGVDAVLFDAGGILVIPDPTVMVPLLEPFGAATEIDAHVRAHYRGMAAKSATGAGETSWDDYDLAYCAELGIGPELRAFAAQVLQRTRNAYLWRYPVPGALDMLRALAAADVPIGVVSNASGQIEDVLRRSGLCQVGDGPLVPVRVVVDSHVVGVAKPDPRIFDYALGSFSGLALDRIAYVGDSVTMDIGAASAAGLHAVLFDPYDDHPQATFARLRSLSDLRAVVRSRERETG